MCLSAGIKKLRRVGARLQPEEWTKNVVLWRGMSDMTFNTEAFMEQDLNVWVGIRISFSM